MIKLSESSFETTQQLVNLPLYFQMLFFHIDCLSFQCMHPANDLLIFLADQVEEVVDLIDIESKHAHVLVESSQYLESLLCIHISHVLVMLYYVLDCAYWQVCDGCHSYIWSVHSQC